MKLQEVEVKKLGQQMVDFVDDVRDLANNGKYAHPIVGLVPAWTADNGEMVFFDAGEVATDRRIYVRLSSSWVLFAQILGNGAASNPGGIEGSVQYNSGGVFGGDDTFIRHNSLGNPVVLNTGRFLIQGTHPSLSILTVSHPTSLNPSFSVNTRGNITLYGGTVGNAAAGVVGIGVGQRPDPATGSVQLYSGFDSDGFTTAGLHVVPEGGGPHWIGQAVVFSNATVTVRNHQAGGGAALRLSGGSADSPANIGLGSSGTTYATIQYGKYSDGTPRRGPHFAIRLLNNSQLFTLLDGGTQLNLSDEQPAVLVGVDSLSGIQGQHLAWSSGNNVVDQRSTLFFTPRLHGVVAPGGGSLTTISNAATVYIQNSPSVITTGSLNVINRYALWVDDGDTRLDGALIVGGSTITPTPFVVNTRALFTTTGLGVASNNAGEITLFRGVVGTTGLTANILSDGRTIRLSALGYFNTPLVVDNLTMRVKVGGQTVLTTGAQTPAASASTLGWKLDTLITCQTTGGAGTVIGQGDSEFHSSLVAKDFWQMVNSSTVVINTTGANAIEITAQWGGVSSASQLFLTNAIGELLN